LPVAADLFLAMAGFWGAGVSATAVAGASVATAVDPIKMPKNSEKSTPSADLTICDSLINA
jgi:hypothetical protein